MSKSGFEDEVGVTRKDFYFIIVLIKYNTIHNNNNIHKKYSKKRYTIERRKEKLNLYIIKII
jgi:hypothetical protein